MNSTQHLAWRWLVSVIAIFIISLTTLQAQTPGYVTIGSGTSETGNGSSVSPVNRNYKHFRYQVLYTKDEIVDAGGAAGNISKLAWNIKTHPATSLSSYTIKMGHTTATELDSHNSNATTTVYSANYTPSNGWNDLNFTTNFNWNGTSNIIIDICYSVTTTSNTVGSVYTTTGTSPTNRYAQSSSSSQCSINTNYKNFSSKPQVRFYMNTAVAACAAPSNLQLTSVTGTSASFSWTAGAPSIGYSYVVNQSATPPSSGTNSTGTTLTVNSGLSAGTSYYFWIRNRCTASSNSDWINIPFTTTCIAPSITTTSAERCGPGSVSLTASPSAGTTYWWDAASGGNLLSTGNTFNTPSISTTTTYYASAGQALAGNISTTLGAGAYTSTLAS